MTTLMEPMAPWLRDLNRFFAGRGVANTFMPPADILVTDEDVSVYMDVPGLTADNLEIELENDVLTVRGERPFPYDTESRDFALQRIERSFGRFERVLRVPRGLDPESIEASLADGVLSLRIPRPEPVRPRRIEVRQGARDATAGNGARQQDKELEGATTT